MEIPEFNATIWGEFGRVRSAKKHSDYWEMDPRFSPYLQWSQVSKVSTIIVIHSDWEIRNSGSEFLRFRGRTWVPGVPALRREPTLPTGCTPTISEEHLADRAGPGEGQESYCGWTRNPLRHHPRNPGMMIPL